MSLMKLTKGLPKCLQIMNLLQLASVNESRSCVCIGCGRGLACTCNARIVRCTALTCLTEVLQTDPYLLHHVLLLVTEDADGNEGSRLHTH